MGPMGYEGAHSFCCCSTVISDAVMWPPLTICLHRAGVLSVQLIRPPFSCLSPIGDCSGGMPLGWPVSMSPGAGMANSSLPGACRWLNEGDHPKIHSDRGCRYRWPGWIRICDENGLARSMLGKGCSPGSARCEGFFGRLKTEFFHGCNWAGVTIEKFMDMSDAYLRWYRDVRIKGDLDCRSPMQYRRDLGLLAA